MTTLDHRLYAWLLESDEQRFELAFNAYFSAAFPAVIRHVARLSRWDCCSTFPIFVCVFLVGCVPIRADVRYVDPAAAESVSVVFNEGGTLSSCQWGGSGGVCRAWLSAVEGKFPPYEAKRVRVEAGEHAIKLGCNFSRSPLNIASAFAAYQGPFAASRSYFVRCVLENGTPRIWLADSADGPALPEFIYDPPDPDEEAKIQKLPWYQRPVK